MISSTSSTPSWRLPILAGGKVDFSQFKEGPATQFFPPDGKIPLLNWDVCRAEQQKLAEKQKQQLERGEPVARLASLADLPKPVVEDTMRLTAHSFATLEPMHRYFRPQTAASPGVTFREGTSVAAFDKKYSDQFGTLEEYGPFSNANHFYWFIRAFLLQDPTCAQGPALNEAALRLSSAFVQAKRRDQSGKGEEQQPGDADVEPIFTVCVDRMWPVGVQMPPFRAGDPA